MYTTSDLKKGLILEYEEAPCMVESIQISSPSARGASTIFKVRLRNLKTKQKLDKSFRGGDTFAVPDFNRVSCQYLYKDQDAWHFMNQETYDQFFFPNEDIEWESQFLKDELEGIMCLIYNEQVIGLQLPTTVTLQITETPPSIKGASATARTKPATLETGLIVQVPEHISPGDSVNVDTRTGDFLGRAT
jgi:elongation factor P